MKRMAKLAFVILAASGLLAAQEPAKAPQNRLVTGKLIYVGQMPEGLADWIMQDLKDWGRYKPTTNSEGVDLVMKSYRPERYTKYKMRQGIPMPREERRKHGHETPAIASIVVTNWITGDPLWSADILDRKPKRDENQPKPAEKVKIYARGLSNARLATTIINAFRAYVESLSGGKTTPHLQHGPH